jgi:hypothetical protein
MGPYRSITVTGTPTQKKKIRPPKPSMKTTILDIRPTTAFGHIQAELVNPFYAPVIR